MGYKRGYKRRDEVARDKTRKRKTGRRVLETVESLTWFREIILPFGSGATRGFLLRFLS